MAPRNSQRDYASVIAESPVRHAIFNKPFSSLRRRTENLLDTITGGTIPADVIEEQRREKDRLRGLTCRMCKLVFADDRGLSKHYDMFPAHLVEERTKKPQRERQSSTMSGTSRDGSLAASVSKGPSTERPTALHGRARSTPNLFHDTLSIQRPAPSSTAATAVMTTASVSPQPAAPSSHVTYAQPHSLAASTRFASDFYMPSDDATSGYDPVRNHYPSPYAVLNMMTASPHQTGSPSMSVAPHAAAMLPNFDFQSRFQKVNLTGTVEAPKGRPVAKQECSPIAERNRVAGARAVAKSPPLITSPVVTDASHSDPMLQRPVRRGASDGELLGRPAMPSTFADAVRSVVATGATGSKGQAVLASQASPVRQTEPMDAWVPLAGDENELETKKSNRSRSGSTSGRQWGTLLDGLPGSPQSKSKESPFKELQPVKTGVTSFTSDGPSSHSDTASRPRRNTNPFFNRDFMQNVPTLLKTPPLSPSSPWTSPASPGNPFKQLPDDNWDDTAPAFNNATEGPRTPADEMHRMHNKGSPMNLTLPAPVQGLSAPN